MSAGGEWAAAAGGAARPTVGLMDTVEVCDSLGGRWQRGLVLQLDSRGEALVLTDDSASPRRYRHLRLVAGGSADAAPNTTLSDSGDEESPRAAQPRRLRIRSQSADFRDVDGDYERAQRKAWGCGVWTGRGEGGDAELTLKSDPNGHWRIWGWLPPQDSEDLPCEELLATSTEPHRGRPPTEARSWRRAMGRGPPVELEVAALGGDGCSDGPGTPRSSFSRDEHDRVTAELARVQGEALLLRQELLRSRESLAVAGGQIVLLGEQKGELQLGSEALAEQIQQLSQELQASRVTSWQDFPRDLEAVSPDELVDLEMRVEDYLNRVRARRRMLAQCSVCFEERPKVVLMPCLHQALCSGCADRVRDCPVCRCRITQRLQPKQV
eukprot:TRINITY_DN50111_c0_g1_i1.p1 TRINITY_DN50111_c0_g1~~TRINITY_DN50111_c0_g1_i1.p1  ORF type:complete len:411 (+),score=136.23 TRINITY_DN50111_c0_g1_i1:90-1235(+)